MTVDGKGRIAMPSRHRELLNTMGVSQLTVTKNPEGCLMIFPRPAWESFEARIAALPMEGSGWKRVFLGSAMDVEIDGTSRILIAPELRTYAGIDRDVMLLGMGTHFELWDVQRHAAQEARVLQSSMPESLKTFSF